MANHAWGAFFDQHAPNYERNTFTWNAEANEAGSGASLELGKRPGH